MENLIINDVGLINNTFICYLNSVIQSLLSCNKIIKEIMNLREEYNRHDNKIGKLMINIIIKMINNNNNINEVDMIRQLLNYKDYNCSSELLCDLIDNLKLDKLFEIKYDSSITKCNYCSKNPITNKENIINIYAEYSHYKHISKNKIKTYSFDDNIEDIENQTNIITDYTCPLCNRVNDFMISKSKLLKTSDILVILVKQTDDNTNFVSLKRFITINGIVYVLFSVIYYSNAHYLMVRCKDSGITIINDRSVEYKQYINFNNNRLYPYILFYNKV